MNKTLVSIFVGAAFLAAAPAFAQTAPATQAGTQAATQSARIDHMDPPFWWAGMHDHRLQLMVHGDGIGD
jgi:hypothetical protein